MLLISTKAQAWFTDFIIAMMIFAASLTIYFVYTTNLSKEDTSLLNELISDVKSVSSSLVSEGYPLDWNNETVKKIGITNKYQRLDTLKLNNFANLPYNYSKQILGTTYDYLLFFEEGNGSVLNVEGFCFKGPQKNISTNATCAINATTIADKNINRLVKIDRFLTYTNINRTDVIKMVLYIWS